MHIYQSPFNWTRDLLEHLVLVETGFSEGLNDQPSLVASRHDIPQGILEELLRLKVNGPRIAEMFGVCTKTVERRLDDLLGHA